MSAHYMKRLAPRSACGLDRAKVAEAYDILMYVTCAECRAAIDQGGSDRATKREGTEMSEDRYAAYICCGGHLGHASDCKDKQSVG